ncbi:NAD(P)H-dependent oxidoreductase [Kibdelosporangium persicum]|uniref:NAD(P)H-dependent oxidoreductase n=1 Tax=Kibdelosporangium persicum TaxID=2698649 RepID=UPI001FE38B03|nr:NAD(P)H-dependent oxidoreductase [Kibdelosporangium persicum]
MTNAIDHLYEEWGGKPVAYVGYGTYGAVMAVQKPRAQAGVPRMADIGPQVVLTPRECWCGRRHSARCAHLPNR